MAAGLNGFHIRHEGDRAGMQSPPAVAFYDVTHASLILKLWF
jgi:hypothetical protein